jgi:hypothetical protein
VGELDALRVRDEVLQAMYWMRSEGIDDAPTAQALSRFLTVPLDTLRPHLDRLVSAGYLARAGDGLRMTAHGEETGKRAFADEFADMTRPGHGECDDDCWCHDSPEEAARCLEERTGHVH